jgi:hypothetical protein
MLSIHTGAILFTIKDVENLLFVVGGATPLDRAGV